MTEEHLDQFEALAQMTMAISAESTTSYSASKACVTLVAEVRRLQGLIKQAEWEGYDQGWPCCPWCDALAFNADAVHKPTCPAFQPSVGQSNGPSAILQREGDGSA